MKFRFTNHVGIAWINVGLNKLAEVHASSKFTALRATKCNKNAKMYVDLHIFLFE